MEESIAKSTCDISVKLDSTVPNTHALLDIFTRNKKSQSIDHEKKEKEKKLKDNGSIKVGPQFVVKKCKKKWRMY